MNTNAASLQRQPEGSLPQVTWDSNRDSNGLRMTSDLVHKRWNLDVRPSNISISSVHNNSHLIYISSEGCWFDPIIYILWFSTFCTWFAQNIKKVLCYIQYQNILKMNETYNFLQTHNYENNWDTILYLWHSMQSANSCFMEQMANTALLCSRINIREPFQ